MEDYAIQNIRNKIAKRARLKWVKKIILDTLFCLAFLLVLLMMRGEE